MPPRHDDGINITLRQLYLMPILLIRSTISQLNGYLIVFMWLDGPYLCLLDPFCHASRYLILPCRFGVS